MLKSSNLKQNNEFITIFKKKKKPYWSALEEARLSTHNSENSERKESSIYPSLFCEKYFYDFQTAVMRRSSLQKNHTSFIRSLVYHKENARVRKSPFLKH